MTKSNFIFILVLLALLINVAFYYKLKNYKKEKNCKLNVALRDNILDIIMNVTYSLIASGIGVYLNHYEPIIDECERMGKITASVANARNANNLMDESIEDKIPFNTIVKILDETDSFYIVVYEYAPSLNKEVFVSKKYIEELD